MNTDAMEWGVAAASLAATILNINKRRACFVIWLATNLSWTFVDFIHGIHAQSALHAVYSGLAVWGWFSWRPDR